MALLRTTGERTQALESMYRVRAVEEPPDAEGLRSIWHRGASGADLLSVVDKDGMVLRQELQLFEDVLIWERGKALKTGVAREVAGAGRMKAPDDLHFDAASAIGARVAEFRDALEGYSGDDRYLQHVRSRLAEAMEGRAGFSDDEVTRPATQVSSELKQRLKAAGATASRPSSFWWVTAAALLLGAAVALFFFTR